MTRSWYVPLFVLAVVALTIGGIAAFRRLDAVASARNNADDVWPQDSVPLPRTFLPIESGTADYAAHNAEDAEWRRSNARQYTLSELRARGDGRRSARETMQDSVYEATRRGDRARAIADLERWVARNPRDEPAILWLARLLNESGRSEEAVARYRQLLSAKQASGRE